MREVNSLRDYIQRVKDISDRQYGFTKGASMEEAIRKQENIVIPSFNQQRYSFAINIDIKNLFNSSRWLRF